MKLYRVFRKVCSYCENFISQAVTFIRFWLNGVKHSAFKSSGLPAPYVKIACGGQRVAGKGLVLSNNVRTNPLGNNRCIFYVHNNATLTIGENVGMSHTTIITMDDIVIGNDVKLGSGVKLLSSDFHSVNPMIRITDQDTKQAHHSPIHIGNNVFIGMNSIVLKGVTIGDNAVVGAGSVVTKSIPANQIWAGNPAKFIKQID